MLRALALAALTLLAACNGGQAPPADRPPPSPSPAATATGAGGEEVDPEALLSCLEDAGVDVELEPETVYAEEAFLRVIVELEDGSVDQVNLYVYANAAAAEADLPEVREAYGFLDSADEPRLAGNVIYGAVTDEPLTSETLEPIEGCI